MIYIKILVMAILAGVALYVVWQPPTRRRDRVVVCLLAYLSFATVVLGATLNTLNDCVTWILQFIATGTVLIVTLILVAQGERNDRAGGSSSS